MCGIAGFFSPNGDRQTLARDLTAAIACLPHRGPDDAGLWVSTAGAGIAQRRLSIIDLSERGHQPMVSKDGRYFMVFNGEIYNYDEIRRSLSGFGNALENAGDAEVILAAIQQHGLSAVDQFIGMFAFALWDERERIMHLVRDRAGVKPLYYGWDGNTLWFGSELKALRAFSHWQPRMDSGAVHEYLQYGYITPPRSIYAQVRSVPPGSRVELRTGGTPQVIAYWSLLDRIGQPLSGSDEALETELEA